jgi:hypothetical protein
MKRLAFILLLSFLAQRMCGAIAPRNESETIQIGSIDYFGYAGIDLKQIEKRLPIKIGDRITHEVFERDRKFIPDLVKEITSKPATNLAAVCCDQNGNLMIYIGLSGTSSGPIVLNPSPQGKDRLGAAALELYGRYGEAQQGAGVASEDDSQGYALSADPAARKIELAIREYAVSHADLIQRVLRNSSDVEQRRVSSCFLGYADRSANQIKNLTFATKDPDGLVRNNATRALWVLASAKNSVGIGVSPTPFIDLLFSSQWTDRNKSSLVLMQLTQQRDPELLRTLRERAIPPLIEGARWTNPGHSLPFLFILGRIEGISEDRLKKLAATGDKNGVIQAAEQLVNLRHKN